MIAVHIIIATTNLSKYEEISAVLKTFCVTSEMAPVECDEHGETLEEIAEAKARQAYAKIKKPLITEDTGIFFSAYKNFPGTRAKRVFLDIGFDGILKKLYGKRREAAFRTAICYTDGVREKIFTGELKGRIAGAPAGSASENVPYEKIFIPTGGGAPLSFMSRGEKNAISHRAQAARKFAEWFRSEG